MVASLRAQFTGWQCGKKELLLLYDACQAGEKKRKNYAGSGDSPHINSGKEDTQGRDTVCPLHQERNERGQCGSGGH
eukprot:1158280-Pelagomonas_calceolata.AAC.3